MSADSTTIKRTYDHPLFDPEEHRSLAAIDLGVDPTEIHCIGTGPDGIVTVSPDLHSEDGTLLKARVLSYTRITTWEAKPTVQREPEPERVEAPALTHHVPKLSRGACWNGIQDGIEGQYISTGEKLVLIDSAEGFAVLKDLREEHAAHLAATGG